LIKSRPPQAQRRKNDECINSAAAARGWALCVGRKLRCGGRSSLFTRGFGLTPPHKIAYVVLILAVAMLNQTIMYGIAMLVIAAVVGTNGLEQPVYIGLSDGDFGAGITAGIAMAIIAIIVNRMIQAWSRKRQEELRLCVE